MLRLPPITQSAPAASGSMGPARLGIFLLKNDMDISLWEEVPYSTRKVVFCTVNCQCQAPDLESRSLPLQIWSSRSKVTIYRLALVGKVPGRTSFYKHELRLGSSALLSSCCRWNELGCDRERCAVKTWPSFWYWATLFDW